MKKENGITLVALVITIVLILIVASVATTTGLESYRIANTNNFIAKMKVIQEKVNILKEEYKLWEPTDGTEKRIGTYCDELGFVLATNTSTDNIEEFQRILSLLANTEGITSWKLEDEILQNYYYFNSNDLEQKLNIKNLDNMEVIINFNTGNVVSKNGIPDINRTKIIRYRQYDCVGGQQLIYDTTNSNTFSVIANVNKNYGLSKNIEIKLVQIQDGAIVENAEIPEIYKVYYKKYDSEEALNNSYKWIDAETSKDFNIQGQTATFSLDIAANYQFKVIDINKIEYNNMEATNTYLELSLCNPPELLDGMIPICWKEIFQESTNSFELMPVEVLDINSPVWYDYSSTERRMANAITPDGSMWVWIPRFCYTSREKEVDGELTNVIEQLEFVSGISKTTTSNTDILEKSISSFSKNGESTGIWVAKFHSSYDENSNILKSIPGANCTIKYDTIGDKKIEDGITITVEAAKEIAENNCTKYVYEKIRPYSRLMTEHDRLSAYYIAVSMFGVNTIGENTSDFAGGGAEDAYIENESLSTTKNVYGIYDLYPDENEIIEETTSEDVDAKFYRPVLVSKYIK